jgi:heme/copper-type cytochrome/quinol oxidase subunit 2
MCGIGHGIMGARIVIENSEEHAAWMSQNGSGKLAAR